MARHRDRFAMLVAGFAVSAVLLAAGLARSYVSSTWYEDASGYEEAVRQQKLFHAPMLVYFRVDWCPHCKAFDQLLEDGQVRGKLGEAIKVRINPEHGEAERKVFADRFGGKGYPSIYWLASENDAPRKISNKGPADAFLAQLGR